MNLPLLVSPQWLHDHLTDPQVQVLENAWIAEAYPRAHISGAVSVPGHPYLKTCNADGQRSRHVMETGEFTALCHELGLRRDRHYVIYDDYFGLFAARFWWVCRYFGLDNISILDGSWRGWLEQGRPVSSRQQSPSPGSDAVVAPQVSAFIGWEELLQIHDDPQVQIWDTRRNGEFTGEEESDNQRRGHVPGALNLVWTDLLTEPTYEGGPRFLKPQEELDRQLTDLGLRRDKTIITYCQSGIRAAFAIFVLELLGYPHHRLYDASMGEWANLDETPLSNGPATPV